MSIDDLTNAFWSKVSEFIEEEDEKKVPEVISEEGEQFEGDAVDEDSDDENKLLDDEKGLKGNDQQELLTLLKILEISFVHKKGKVSGITNSFDFKKFLRGKAFANDLYKDNNANGDVDPVKLRRFIWAYKETNANYLDFDTFLEFLDGKYDWIDDNSKAKFINLYKANWDSRQKEIIKSFDKIDRMFMDRKIAIISTREITATDMQKIFNLINTGGTKLTASEILSAKPKWNQKLMSTPDSKMISAINNLYKNLDLGNVSTCVDPVKWDIPASLTYFLENGTTTGGLSLFFRFSDDKDGISNRITIGFKLLAGFFLGGVKKEDIDKLNDNKSFDWQNYQDNINDIKNFFDALKNNPYLSIIQSWGRCLSDVLSDGPTMNLLFILYRSWVRLDRPSAYQTTKMNIFNKNVFIMLDKSFYMYMSNQWKGSSDSTIAHNIQEFKKAIPVMRMV